MSTKTKRYIGCTLAPGSGWFHAVALPEGTVEVSVNEDGAVIDDEPVEATPPMVLEYLGLTGIAGLFLEAARFATREHLL